jgi:hypothetical protein
VKEFTNEDRSRRYGKRVGDRVRYKYFNWSFEGTVVDLGYFDNNKVYVKKDDGEIVDCVAEWCEILEKVEDIEKRTNNQ